MQFGLYHTSQGVSFYLSVFFYPGNVLKGSYCMPLRQEEFTLDINFECLESKTSSDAI
jgi:hypothetical protein